MRILISMVAGAVFAATLAVPAVAAEMTIKGSVTCFPFPKEPDKPAPDDAATMACAKKGMPIGIRTADDVYRVAGDYLANNNAKLLDFVSRVVIASGEVAERDGKKTMNVKSIKLVLD